MKCKSVCRSQFIRFILRCLMPRTPVTQFDDQNAKCKVQMTAIMPFLMQLSFKFQSPACHIRHLILMPKGYDL